MIESILDTERGALVRAASNPRFVGEIVQLLRGLPNQHGHATPAVAQVRWLQTNTETVWQLRHLTAVERYCPARSDMMSPGGIPYACTLEQSHAGGHATVADDGTYLDWI